MVAYPSDWSESILDDVIKIKRGASPRPIESYLTFSSSGVNWIKIGDAPQDGKYIISTAEKITKDGAKRSVRVCPGDFILSNSMSFGRPYLLKIDGCIHDGWLRLYDFQNEVDKDFLYYLLSSSSVKGQYDSFAAGSGVQNLNKEVVKKVQVHLPLLAEQQAIASVLSDFDEHINNLAKLIEKKKAIRDGALEDLVSGKTRVDSFEKEWETVSFNQVIKPKARIGWQGLKKEEYLRSGYSYLIGGTDFHNGKVNLENISYVSKERYDMDSNIQVESNNVLVTKDGTIGKVALVPKLDKPATLNSGVFVFRTTSSLLPTFLYRVLLSSIFKEFINTLSAGSTIKHLYQKDLSNFEFRMPQDIREQQAIASVLTAMDEEIESLEIEKEKIMGIREGAMDDLLTGRVRLKL
ncbi:MULTISPECIES: restriction endonuclease subunit S [Bacillaceae]|uniref:restriction endonuclease subunit S n=1 Tax=Bacillaceae TaxID=186817 RepID=UPI000A49276A|nr:MULTISPECIES: restriction endonuclease subunit S [Bacillaceae]MBU8790934.1 restriction endonuclease subunit S [Oceanobacillus caeni]MCU5244173.1 restriction endonuclease subunit S [Bacillus pacificus]MCU5416662.1 restriction endonuclease subunit S [Bacillus pacificus]MCU5465976.1 restriction endonuclease subunit S [Bacillus pacificus]